MEAQVYVNPKAREVYPSHGSSVAARSFLEIIVSCVDDMVKIERVPFPYPGEIIIAGSPNQGFVHINETRLNGILPEMLGTMLDYGHNNRTLAARLKEFKERFSCGQVPVSSYSSNSFHCSLSLNA